MDRAPYDAWRGTYGGTLVGTCIDLGRRGRPGDAGGDPSSVEADPGSCERSPSMAPRIRPCLVLVGESTGANALRYLKLRSCLSSRVADPSGDPGVDSGVSEDRKNQLGVRDGVCDCDAAARGVASLPGCSSAATASLGPGLVSLLRTPHLLTDPIRDRMEDLGLLLEDSEGGRSAGAGFGLVGWGGEGRGVGSCSLSRSSKTLLSGGRDFFRRRLRPFWAGGLGGNMVREAPPRKGRCATDEYVGESRPEGTEKTDMVGEPGKASPGGTGESGNWGRGGGGEDLLRVALRECAVTVLSSSWSAKSGPSSSSDESHV